MKSKKTSSLTKTGFQNKAVPAALEDLPRYGITSSRAVSRELSSRHDIAFGVRSLDDLMKEIHRGFGSSGSPRKSEDK